MVNIIDGYTKNQEFMQRYETLHSLAIEFFGKERITSSKSSYNIPIFSLADKSRQGFISTHSSYIKIFGEEDLEKAIKLAEKYEEIFDEEWGVEHTHEREYNEED